MKQISFTIFFEKVYKIIPTLGFFFVDHKKINNLSISKASSSFDHWKDPSYNVMKSFFLGSSPSINYSIFFSNSMDGWITGVNAISRIASLKAIYVIISEDGLFYYKIVNGEQIRIIQLYKDSTRWEFFQKGESLEYEKLNLYDSKNLRNRFSKNTIIEYLSYEGIILNDILNEEYEGVILKTLSHI